MSEIVRFVSKYSQYRLYSKGKLIAFENGELITSDKDVVEAIKKARDFGIAIFIDSAQSVPEKDSSVSGEEEGSVAKEVSEVIDEPKADAIKAPIVIKKKVKKGNKR